MPAPDSPTLLVARFLKDNAYDKTLAAFLDETGLALENIAAPDGLRLEDVLDEKRLFDLALKVKKVAISEDCPPFTEPYPSIPTNIAASDSQPSNILFVTVATQHTLSPSPVLIATSADRCLRIYTTLEPYKCLRSYPPSESTLLSVAPLCGTHLITSSMTGRLSIFDPLSGKEIASIRPHTKYCIRVLSSPHFIASASYDKTIFVCELSKSPSGEPEFGEELGRLELLSRPEAFAFVGKMLVYSRADCAELYYHHLEPGLPLHHRQILSPHGGAGWLMYSPMSIAVHPRDPTLLAVGTSSIPHMKLLIVRVGKDEGCVETEVFTGAPQSVYSTAVVAWRPDGSGIWVNSDDGIVRGVEARTGKVKASLKVCEGGEKVRTLWAGMVVCVRKQEGEHDRETRVVQGKEMLVSGGFDKRLAIWNVGG